MTNEIDGLRAEVAALRLGARGESRADRVMYAARGRSLRSKRF